MATIQSAIRIHDGYSPIIKNMIKVNQNIISSFGATEQASGKAFNLQAIKAAQSALAQVETDFDDVERLSKNEVFNLFKTNLASIARYKMESQNKKAVISTAELSDLKLVENE